MRRRDAAWGAAIAASAQLAIADGPREQRALLFVFKPLTTLLLIVFAAGRGADEPAVRRWVLAGLALSLAGDVALLWPREGFLPGLVAFALAHVAYIAAFTRGVRFGARPLFFAAYALVAAVILLVLWPGVPASLRVPVLVYVLCLASMAAQASTRSRIAALGGALFFVSDALLATNKFAQPLPLANVAILSTYWLAQGCIAVSLNRAK